MNGTTTVVENHTKLPESLSPMCSKVRQPKIAIFGTFGTGNLGNECTLQAMLHNIQRYLPDAEIICVCSGPEETAARCGIPAFPIRYAVSIRQVLGVRSRRENKLVKWLRKLIRLPMGPYRWYKAFTILRNQDTLVITGLGMLGDFGIRPFGLHYDILGWSIIAKLCGCRLLFVSVGVGPVRHPVSRLFVKAALALGDYRSYRDRFSKEYLERIGFKTKSDYVYPDLVFSLPRTMPADGEERKNRKPVIGVGLLNYYNRRGRTDSGAATYRDYMAGIAALVSGLMEREDTVRLLIGDTVYDQGARQDLRGLLEARGWNYGDPAIIDEPATSVDELLSQLATTDLVVASRFHNLLLAIMLGKPVVALSYHEKIVSLMEELGLSEFCHDIEHLDVDKLIGQITELTSRAGTSARRTAIEKQIQAYREMLDEQYERIFRGVPLWSAAP